MILYNMWWGGQRIIQHVGANELGANLPRGWISQEQTGKSAKEAQILLMIRYIYRAHARSICGH